MYMWFLSIIFNKTNHYFSNVIPFVDTHSEKYITIRKPGIGGYDSVSCPGFIVL